MNIFIHSFVNLWLYHFDIAFKRSFRVINFLEWKLSKEKPLWWMMIQFFIENPMSVEMNQFIWISGKNVCFDSVFIKFKHCCKLFLGNKMIYDISDGIMTKTQLIQLEWNHQEFSVVKQWNDIVLVETEC
jgi:hypothetical protein